MTSELKDQLVNWRMLALGIIQQAMQDLVRPQAADGAILRARQSGWDFFFDKECLDDLEFWSQQAGLQRDYVRRRATDVFRNQIDLAKVAAELASTESSLDDSDDDYSIVH